MEKRVYNFSPGPAVLPLPALEEAQRDLLALPGVGISILEISHRSKYFDQVIEQAEANLRTLLGIPENYRVLFLQGGALLQFGMIPMNFLRNTRQGGRLHRHRHLVEEGRRTRPRPRAPCATAWDGKSGNYNRVPRQDELKLDPNAAYVYFTSNETIQGVQFTGEPDVGDVPLVCDASSDFLCRPVPIAKLRHPLRLRAEERRPGGRDHRHHPRRPGRAVARPIFPRCSTTRCWPRTSRC